MPVLPLVPSTTVPPGFNLPSRSACSMIGAPMRSLIEPPGLKYSAFAYTGVRMPRVTRESRMRGVHPINSATAVYGFRFLLVVMLLLLPSALRTYGRSCAVDRFHTDFAVRIVSPGSGRASG